MAKKNFTQALIEIGAEAKDAQKELKRVRDLYDRQDKRVQSLEQTSDERYNRIEELKKELAIQEANLRLEFGKRIGAFEEERNQLIKERDKLKDEFYDLQVNHERAQRAWSEDCDRLWQRYNFARKFISKAGLGRKWGAAIRKFTPKKNH